MSDPVTTNLSLAVPVTGTDVDTWGTVLNSDWNIMDACLGSVTAKSLTNANVTLSTVESRVSILRFTGTLSGNCIITLGAVSKSWVCENLCTDNGFTVTVQGSPATGNIVALPPGSCQIYWDGTNVSFLNLGKVGEYWDYCGNGVPAWVTACTVPPYLYCNGSAFSAVTYPLLAAIIGGTTLPDSRGRSRFSLDASTNRVTSGQSGVDGSTLFASGGDQRTQDHMHNNTFNDANHHHTPTDAGTNSYWVKGGGGAAYFLSGGGTAASADMGNLSTSSESTGASISNASYGSGGSQNMPPAYIGGLVMIRAA